MLVVEAAIIVTVVTMFIAVMLYICMVLYQQALGNIMANQTASNIAQIYGNTLRDPFTGYVDADGIHEEVTYTNLRNQAYMDVIEQKADAAALYRLKSARVLTTGETEVTVQVVPKTNELLKDQVVVTIRDHYVLPLVSFFGVSNNALTFESTGRADCTDLLEYLTGVPALGTTDGNAVAFSEEECTVNFYNHYGDARPIKTVTVLRGYSINYSTEYSHSTMPTRPTQDRMRFNKWVTEDGRVFTGDSIVGENMNVYGSWECTVTFDPDGGLVDPAAVTATVFGNISLPTAQRDNCTFGGWYTAKNGEGEPFTGVNVQGDITVYAKWVCTVVFNADGGAVSPTSYDVIYGKTLQDSGLAAPSATRSGCTFAGWYTQQYGAGTAFANTTAVNGNTIVIAKWLATVTVDATGGSFSVNNGKVDKQNVSAVVGLPLTIAAPTAPYQCWSFSTYNTMSNGSGATFESGKTIVTGQTTLYAQWKYSHKYANYTLTKTATCQRRSEWTGKCVYCGKQDVTLGETAEHSWNARCGKEHQFTRDSMHYISSHTGADTDAYLGSTWAECYLCEHCLTPWGEAWKWLNGQKVSVGMICIIHLWCDGYEYDDRYYKASNTNSHLHG